MSHPAGKRRTKFYLPGYHLGDMNDDLDVRARNKAEIARRKGAKYFEYRGFLFVRVRGGKFCEWTRAKPKEIGRD